MITLSPAAISELQRLLQGRAGEGLRLIVEKGGCAGLQYAMKVSPSTPADATINAGGARVLIDPASQPYLQGCHLDFSESLNDAGFKINNPNAVRSCGCGTSFEPATAPTAPLPEGPPCESAASAASAPTISSPADPHQT